MGEGEGGGWRADGDRNAGGEAMECADWGEKEPGSHRAAARAAQRQERALGGSWGAGALDRERGGGGACLAMEVCAGAGGKDPPRRAAHFFHNALPVQLQVQAGGGRAVITGYVLLLQRLLYWV